MNPAIQVVPFCEGACALCRSPLDSGRIVQPIDLHIIGPAGVVAIRCTLCEACQPTLAAVSHTSRRLAERLVGWYRSTPSLWPAAVSRRARRRAANDALCIGGARCSSIQAQACARTRGGPVRSHRTDMPMSHATPPAVAGIAGVNTRPLHAATLGIAGNWGSTLRPHLEQLLELMAANLRSLLSAYAGLWTFPAPSEVPTDPRDTEVRLELRRRLAAVQLDLFANLPVVA